VDIQGSKVVAPRLCRLRNVRNGPLNKHLITLREKHTTKTRPHEEQKHTDHVLSSRLCASRPSRYVLVINDNHLVSLMNFNEAKEN
jgi:hypothetical protein